MNNLKVILIKNLKPYSKYIPEINKATMRSLVKLCVSFLEYQKYSKEAYDKEVLKMTAMNPTGPKNFDIYCTIVMILIETFLKCRKPGEDLSAILRELKFQEECVEDLNKVLTTNQLSLHEHFQMMKLPKSFDKLEYKIDISLMESGQQPSVILHLEENRGEQKTINLPMKDFHHLRLAVASSLAEIQALETKRT